MQILLYSQRAFIFKCLWFIMLLRIYKINFCKLCIKFTKKNQNVFYPTIFSVYFNTEIQQSCEYLHFCIGVVDVSVLLYVILCQWSITS
jgi:hypothetical protein